MQLKRISGFSLVELAVVVAIVGLLIGMGIFTMNAQLDIRQQTEINNRLNTATDALIAFATVNKRLPCPAYYIDSSTHSSGLETFCTTATGGCTRTLTVQTHGTCSNFYDGYLPAATIGYTPVDSSGFALDIWGNRIRYAVARDFATSTCNTDPVANTRIWTSQNNLKLYGVGCKPNDLDVCTSTTCAARAVATQTVVLLVFSTGKNGGISAGYGADETENTNGDARFVVRPVTTIDSPLGVFDDTVMYMSVGQFYQKLIAAGVLP